MVTYAIGFFVCLFCVKISLDLLACDSVEVFLYNLACFSGFRRMCRITVGTFYGISYSILCVSYWKMIELSFIRETKLLGQKIKVSGWLYVRIILWILFHVLLLLLLLWLCFANILFLSWMLLILIIFFITEFEFYVIALISEVFGKTHFWFI